MKMLLVVLIVLFAVAHAQHDHEANVHAIANQMAHLFEHDIDLNKDGVTTVDEELAWFHQHDDGDCQWTYAEMKASREHGHGAHGPVHFTEEQLRAIFTYYDTRGCTQAADGHFKCDDIPFFFHILDANGDGQMTLQEFTTGSQQFTSALTTILTHGGSCTPITVTTHAA